MMISFYIAYYIYIIPSVTITMDFLNDFALVTVLLVFALTGHAITQSHLHHLDGYRREHYIQPSYQYEICVMSRMRNIHLLLSQWIEFHLIAGIDHFILLDDCSDDFLPNDRKEMDTLFVADSSTKGHKRHNVLADEFYTLLAHLLPPVNVSQTVFLMKIWARYYPNLVTLHPPLDDNDCSHHVPNEFHLLNELYHHYRHKCQWMLQLDPDEYIFPSIDPGKCWLKDTVVDLRDGDNRPVITNEQQNITANLPNCTSPLKHFLRQQIIPVNRDRQLRYEQAMTEITSNHSSNSTTASSTHQSIHFDKLSHSPFSPALYRFPLIIMSNEGLLHRPTNPSKLITDTYFHGNFFSGNRLIKTIAQTKYFHDWQWPNYPDKLNVTLCERDMCMDLESNLVKGHYWRNPRIAKDELSESNLYINGATERCGLSRYFPFYIRHYQALSWDDHQLIRVKRRRSASNTANGWANDADGKAWLTWKSYHFNSTCPLGGEGYRKVVSEEIIKAMKDRYIIGYKA